MKALLVSFCVSAFVSAFGQINPPLVSPHSIIQQHIGVSEVTVDYSRPGKRGRQVMGNLVPYGRIWRVGANESTKITFTDDVKVAGHEVPKGTYALYAFPYEKEWTIIIHKNTQHWGDGRDEYDEKEDWVRFKVKPEKIPYLQESFLITFDELDHNGATMKWLWEYTSISFKIEVDTDKKMMEQIEDAIATNPTADTYYQSARYLQEENKMQKQALLWLDKAHDLAGDKYYIHRVWSLVLAQVKDYTEAIAHAEKSKELAALENKDEFVRMNESSIKEWRSLLKKP
jgi:REP element-mobilizing transposase RayT